MKFIDMLLRYDKNNRKRNIIEKSLTKLLLKTPFVDVNINVEFNSYLDNGKSTSELKAIIKKEKDKGLTKNQVIEKFNKELEKYHIVFDYMPKVIYGLWEDL